MSDQQEDQRVKPEDLPPGVELRPHEYDGIQEFDQKLPNWWLWTFYGAMIIFTFFWVGYYQLGLGRSDADRIDDHMKMVAEMQAGQLAVMFADDPNGALWKMSRDALTVENGKKVFESNCVVCHAADLSGSRSGAQYAGLPLDDNEWKYCDMPVNPKKVFDIVTDGSPDKTSGMQAWGNQLGTRKVSEVAAYVLSHHEAPPEALEDAPAKSGSDAPSEPGGES